MANLVSSMPRRKVEVGLRLRCDAWNGLMKDADRIASITTRAWAQVNV